MEKREPISKRFARFKNSQIGAVVTLSRTIRGMKYGKGKITNAFNKLVPKGEYELDEKEAILEDLWQKGEFGEVDLTPINKKNPVKPL